MLKYIKIGMGVRGMSYNYSVDSKLYIEEINYFFKNSIVLKKIRLNTLLQAIFAQVILWVILLGRKINSNIYNEDIIYLVLEYILILIIAVTIEVVFGKFYLNKIWLKYWKEEYTHTVGIENDEIYYSGPSRAKRTLNNNVLKEVMDLDNIIGIVVTGSKHTKNRAIIIIPKKIIKSEESLNRFKNILESKLKKNE